jgi:phosphoglycerol transferase MdoB-like AlkP superfamily enzyme
VWIFAVGMLFIIAYIYLISTPLINMIADFMVELGTPKHSVLWVQRNYAWGFGVLFIGVILWGLVWSYKREDDTGWNR